MDQGISLSEIQVDLKVTAPTCSLVPRPSTQEEGLVYTVCACVLI